MRKPSASTWPSRKSAPGALTPRPSDVADAREHLGAEQVERAHQRIEIARPRRMQGQVEHTRADLVAAAPHLLHDRIGPADERRGERTAHDRRPRLAGDVTGVELV